MRSRAKNPSDSRRYYDWINRAEVDLNSAKLLISDEELFIAAAFHCQQCVEKLLKGYVLFVTNKLIDGHNLTWLCKQAMQYDHKFEEWLDESFALNKYYIETRYPTDFDFEIDVNTINSVYKMTEDMFDFVVEQVADEAFAK